MRNYHSILETATYVDIFSHIHTHNTMCNVFSCPHDQKKKNIFKTEIHQMISNINLQFLVSFYICYLEKDFSLCKM